MNKFLLGLLLLSLSVSVQAQIPTSDPKALAFVAQSVAAMTGGSPISDATLSGTVNWTLGSDQQTGTVTLLTKGLSESRIDLNLSGGTRTEIRNTNGTFGVGNWIGTDGSIHEISLHNCLTDASWFLPSLGTLAAAVGKPNVIFGYVGLEKAQQSSFQHLHAYTLNNSWTEAQQLSTMDFYLDSQTLLPMIVAFSEHPDTDPAVDIAVAVMFSDYRKVSGSMIPFHIQRYVNNSLMLDIQLTSASLNSGVSDNLFKVQ